MMDEEGFDPGIITGIGLLVASAMVLLFVLLLFKSSGPANSAIVLEASSSETCGDIETVASMAIPYRAERYYGFDGIGVSIGADYVTATAGNDTFARPLTSRIVPGTYRDNGTLLWKDTAGLREYLNATFNATGTEDRPIDNNSSRRLHILMDRASRSTLLYPICLDMRKPLIIEKTFIYTLNGSSHAMEAEPYVLVFQ